MTTLGVIPARLAATRFPEKPLVAIDGIPLIIHVLRAARRATLLDRVVVATPDAEIVACVEGEGGEAVVTSAEHRSGTDRVAEAARLLGAQDVVANIQGDLPLLTTAMVDALVTPFGAPDPPQMTTVAAPLAPADMDDPNTVKVICDRNDDALYFSRAPIPHPRNDGPPLARHHIGLYAFTAAFLQHVASLEPTPLEQREGLEQLRVLEHGHRIRVGSCDGAVPEVHVPEDVALVESYIARRAQEGDDRD